MDRAIYKFPTRDEAWAFLARCDAKGLFVGWPSADNTVEVLFGSWVDRPVADRIAGRKPIKHTFGCTA